MIKPGSKFIRFVVVEPHITPKYVWSDPWYSTGVITYCNILLKGKQLSVVERDCVKSIFKWFNGNIPCPPYSRKRELWSPDAVAWFYSSAREPINKLKPLIKILRKHGLRVSTLRADFVGKIVYRDKFQVVAITPTLRERKKKERR